MSLMQRKETNKAVRGATSKEAASFAAFFNKPVNVERVNRYQETLAFNKKQKTIISLLSFCVILLLVFVTRNTIESGKLPLGYVLLLLDTIVISLYSVILLEMIKEMIINKFKKNSRW